MTRQDVRWPQGTGRVVSVPRALLAAAVLAALVGCKPAPTPPAVIQSVKVQTVGASDVQHSGAFAGVVAARTEARLGFRVAGKLIERSVGVGDVVKAGQLLAQLDAQDYRLSAAAAQAQVTAAATQRDLAQADVQRYRTLRDQSFISAAEMDRREASLKGAQASLDQAQAQLSAQRNQASYTRLQAEADGVITGVEAEVGQVVGAGAPVFRLARDGERDAVFAVPEDQLALFAVGTPVAVRVWATGAAIAGSVREVSASADAVSRTFSIKVALQGAASGLPPLGSTVAVQLTHGPQAVPVIKLPMAAVREVQGRSEVWVLNRDTMQLSTRAVVVQGMDKNSLIIGSGLNAGEDVVVAGVHVLAEGQKVRVYQPQSSVKPTPREAPTPAPAASPAEAGASLAMPASAAR